MKKSLTSAIQSAVTSKVEEIRDNYIDKIPSVSEYLGKGSSSNNIVASGVKVGNTNIPTISGNMGTINFDPSSLKSISNRIKASYGLPDNVDTGAMLERHYLNRLNVTLIDNIVPFYRCYIFIGKPQLYLFEQDGRTLAPTIKSHPILSDQISYEPDLYQQLCGYIKGKTDFLTALGNRCTGMSIQDGSVGTEQSAANNKGIRQEYATTYIESMVNVPSSLTFSMDRNAEALKLIDVWIKYEEGVKEGAIFQRPKDDALNKMSYTAPIWVFACEENGMDIVFWAKLTGNYPKSAPFSIFSYTPYNHEAKDITVQFHTSLFRPFDTVGIAEFNAMSKNRSRNYLDKWIKPEDRNLKYYWNSGAVVRKNPKNGKLQLVFFTE